jgi:hypothetical protein
VALASGIGKVFNVNTFRGGVYYGPFGLLGNITAYTYMGETLLIRLSSFWLEPSNASGYFFMTFFLAEAIYGLTNQRRWKIASVTCFIGGFLCLSNAGYLAIGCSLLIGEFIKIKSEKSRGNALLIVICIFLILISLFGRSVGMQYFRYNKAAIMITGIRGADRKEYDPYEGRVILFKDSIEKVKDNLVGIGFQIPGEGEFGKGVYVSASAPVQWFTFTGIIGLLLLLLRELQIFATLVSYSPLSKFQLSLFQAWMAIFFQNLSYGTWMVPMYFLIAIIYLVNLNYEGQGVVKVAPAL